MRTLYHQVEEGSKKTGGVGQDRDLPLFRTETEEKEIRSIETEEKVSDVGCIRFYQSGPHVCVASYLNTKAA
jgi:hypothetical protein